jgi:4-hydroxy-tetrahydrodipicolinate synthase
MKETEISGIIPPLVTPLTPDLKFDADAYLRLIEHVINGGVNGLFIIGTNGESTSLTNVIRKKVINTAIDGNSNRLPLFVNISTSSYIETLQLAEYAAGSGADFLVLSPPFYYLMNQRELVRYYEKIANQVALPLFMYNAPQYTKTEITPESVKELPHHANILGIKDSSGKIEYIHRLLDQREDKAFKIFVGLEMILGECILLGCDGGVNGGGNLFPRLYVRMYQSAMNSDLDEMKKLQSAINKVYKNIYEVSDSPMGITIGLKYALFRMGIGSGNLAMPVYDDLTDRQKGVIDRFLKIMEQYVIGHPFGQ